MPALLAIAAAMVLGGASGPAEPPCALSTEDQVWLDRAMGAWRLTSREITGVGDVEAMRALIFDSGCLLTSDTAMSGGAMRWSATRHAGSVPLPGGSSLPAQVVSFAAAGDGSSFFVMSAPSVWKAGKVEAGALGLDHLMTAVLLHEGTHVAQMPSYGERMTRLSKRNALPDDFDDDSIQMRFESNPGFARSIAEETRLLLAAAGSPSRNEAVRLVRKARHLGRARQGRWYPAKDRYLREAEDIWLTLEGSGQWAAYQWLIHPEGGRMDAPAAIAGFGQRGKWWSQTQGFALFLALDRLAGSRWKRHAFGDGKKTVLQMLNEALAAT